MRLHESIWRQKSNRNVNVHEYNYETVLQYVDIVNARGHQVCILFFLIFVRFNLLLISLHLIQLVIYYFSFYTGRLHVPTRYILVARCGFVRRNTCSSPSCIRHTKFFSSSSLFFLCFSRSFFLSSLSSKYVSGVLQYHGKGSSRNNICKIRQTHFFVHVCD